MFEAYEKLLGASFSNRQRLLLTLPTSKSGVGIRSASRHHLPAFLASRLFVHDRVVKLLKPAFGNSRKLKTELETFKHWIKQYTKIVGTEKIPSALSIEPTCAPPNAEAALRTDRGD